jgi:hypothetical protein
LPDEAEYTPLCIKILLASPRSVSFSKWPINLQDGALVVKTQFRSQPIPYADNPAGSLESRFFVDDGLWKTAPMLTGQTSFEPLPDVRNIMVTGGEGFMFVYLKWLPSHCRPDDSLPAHLGSSATS